MLLTLIGIWFAAGVVVAIAWSFAARRFNGSRLPLGERTRRRRRATFSQAILLGAAVAVGAAESHPGDWQPLTLVFMLGALALATDAVPLTIGRYRFTGGFVAIVSGTASVASASAPSMKTSVSGCQSPG